MKQQNNKTTKQTELINYSKEFKEKLITFDSKFVLKLLRAKPQFQKKLCLTLLIIYKSLNEKVIEIEKYAQTGAILFSQMHRN